ncbi:YqaJ viral recombinase family protein [Isoptericola dokdonensis]|uniref:YqaJ-like viral recombinase domain protein n=1 Tax=Isoptericola dokdonensis DS-3 TaxID=1300344 RepID=A0A161IDX4_9MICO|nr:YqaJ viral recombinase family protein [Isoptericola dokdonensis]ANC31467.1 YqaJ-like viral recombinase domain protein [Isoptericola dokdonensis DS-3]
MTLPDGLGGELILDARDYSRSRIPWLQARRTGLGASETAAVLNLSDWKTPLQVWLDKTSTAPVEDVHVSEAAEWGSVLEAVVARKVGTRHRELGKIAPTPGLLRHPEHPWMLATLDRLLVERGTANPRVLAALEVKTTSLANYIQRWEDNLPPLSIQVQVQQQLAVTGLDRIWVAVLVGGQRMPAPIPIDRNERVIEQLINYGGRWWNDHVVGGEQPAPTFGDRKTLHKLWPGDQNLDDLTASDDVLDAHGRLVDARRRKAEAEADADAAAFELQTALGDRTALRDRDGRLLATWKPQTSSRIDSARLRKNYPAIAKAVTKQSTARRFLPKEHDA